jgi:hypothetical protein
VTSRGAFLFPAADLKNKLVAYSWKPAHFSHFSAAFSRARAHPLFSKNSLHFFTFPLQSFDSERVVDEGFVFLRLPLTP